MCRWCGIIFVDHGDGLLRLCRYPAEVRVSYDASSYITKNPVPPSMLDQREPRRKPSMPMRSGKCSRECHSWNSSRCAGRMSHHMATAALPKSAISSNLGKTSVEPAGRNRDQLGEHHHQKHHRELGDHEGDDTLGDVVHADLADTRHHVEHRAHRRRHQPDRVVDDEQNTEVDRVYACGLDHG